MLDICHLTSRRTVRRMRDLCLLSRDPADVVLTELALRQIPQVDRRATVLQASVPSGTVVAACRRSGISWLELSRFSRSMSSRTIIVILDHHQLLDPALDPRAMRPQRCCFGGGAFMRCAASERGGVRVVLRVGLAG